MPRPTPTMPRRSRRLPPSAYARGREGRLPCGERGGTALLRATPPSLPTSRSPGRSSSSVRVRWHARARASTRRRPFRAGDRPARERGPHPPGGAGVGAAGRDSLQQGRPATPRRADGGRPCRPLDRRAGRRPRDACAGLARLHFLMGVSGRASELLELALEIAEALQLPEILAQALNTKSLVLENRPTESGALLRAGPADRPGTRSGRRCHARLREPRPPAP